MRFVASVWGGGAVVVSTVQMTSPEYLLGLYVTDTGGKESLQRSQKRVHLWQWLNANHALTKTNAGFFPFNGGSSLLLASSWQRTEIICMMQRQSVHLLVESLEKKTALC